MRRNRASTRIRPSSCDDEILMKTGWYLRKLKEEHQIQVP